MGLKERLAERKEREEARNFFRQNNEFHLTTEKLIKLIITTILAGLFGSFLYALLLKLVGMNFSLMYILIAYLIAKGARKVTPSSKSTVVIVGATSYIISLLAIYFFYLALQNGIDILIYTFTNFNVFTSVLSSSISFIVSSSIFNILFCLLGLFEIIRLLK